MRWYKPLYAGKQAAKHKTAIIRSLRKREFSPGTYVIVRALDSDGLLEIYHSIVFLKDYYQKQDPFIIGIASGKTEAMEVAGKIVDDMYHRNGDFDIDSFCGPEHT